MGYHSGFYSIDHAQDPDSGAQSVVFPFVQVSAEQMEGAVGRVQRLPVVVVEFDIQNTWKSEIITYLIFMIKEEIDFLPRTTMVHSHWLIFVLAPVHNGQVGESLLYVLDEVVLG